MALTFPGGIHPDEQKEATRRKPLEPMAAPARVILPMQMHLGAPSIPLVRKGDRVLLGQKVAEAASASTVPVHAPVSGVVTAVEPRPHPNGSDVLSIVIENDFTDTPDPSVGPKGDPDTLTGEEIIEIVREAGIVGLGGAGRPTHWKMRRAMGKVQTLLINCAECEPYLTAGYRGILEHPREIISGVRLVMRAVGLPEAIFAVQASDLDAAELLEHEIDAMGFSRSLQVRVLKTKYPQGGEKQLIRAVTGKEVPPERLSPDVGCAVFNPETCAAVWRAVNTGLPLVTCLVTVSGSAVANPKNLICRVGTPLEELFAAAGGFREEPHRLIHGGPMMGTAIASPDAPAIKTTNGLLAFSRGEGRVRQAPACIRCGRCIKVCPMRLMPFAIHQNYRKGKIDALEDLHVDDCVECGACAYICPGRVPLAETMREGKARLAERKRKEEQP